MAYHESSMPWHLAAAQWRKSSWSSYDGNCVEVAVLRGGQVGCVTQRAGRKGPILLFSVSEWAQFLGQTQNGDFAFC